MGYDLHITRAVDWCDNNLAQIAIAEWHDIIQQDPELSWNPYNGKHFADWTPNDCQKRETYAWFDWFDGNIYTKNPDKKTIEKMKQLAQRLNAQVQGDNGEVY